MNPVNTTTYTVTVVNAEGCRNTLSTTVTVRELDIQTNPTDTLKACLGEIEFLEASGGETYSWFPTTNLLNPNSARTEVLPEITPIDYIVTATDRFGCIGMDTVTVVGAVSYTHLTLPTIYSV